MSERMVKANGVDLCTEAFGDPADPALLLIMGANASMLRWPAAICRRIAGAGRYVIRYDNRDTGGSTAFPPYDPPYDVEDLARDAVGILDAYGIERAHVWGYSMGGMITQQLALDHASRILSIVVMSSTPDPAAIAAAAITHGEVEGSLPLPEPEVFDLTRLLEGTDWSDDAAAIEAWVTEERVLSGSGYPFDESGSREAATQEVRRATNLLSHRFNHPRAVGRTPRWRDRLRDIQVPALVIHGDEDQAFPLPHGVALSREIPGARLLTLEGVGHILPAEAWSLLVPAVLAHTNGNQSGGVK